MNPCASCKATAIAWEPKSPSISFRHQIWVDGFSPQNPRDAAEYFTSLFETLAAAEETVFPTIADLYPPTPEWFLPTH